MRRDPREAFGALYGDDGSDVAGALGFVEAGLGKELLQFLHWKDGASRRGDSLWYAIVDTFRVEHEKQRSRVSAAETDLEILEACREAQGNRPSSHLAGQILRQQDKLAALKASSWPETAIKKLPKLTKAVLAEMESRRECETCKGHGHIRVDGEREDCMDCEGTGYAGISGRSRAAALGVSPSAYGRYWIGVYSWMVKTFSDHEAEAAKQFARALYSEGA